MPIFERTALPDDLSQRQLRELAELGWRTKQAHVFNKLVHTLQPAICDRPATEQREYHNRARQLARDWLASRK